MTPAQVRAAVEAVVRSSFDQAAAAFSANPNGDNWANLVEAMWARQAISSPDTMEKAIKTLPEIGIGLWAKQLRTIHEGKAS